MSGTEMTDLVHYSLPFGKTCAIAHPVVRKTLVEISTYPFEEINEIFGRWPDQKMNLCLT